MRTMDDYLKRFDIQIVGRKQRKEYMSCLGTNSFILKRKDGKSYVVDPGVGPLHAYKLKGLLKEIKDYDILNTHWHGDHIVNNTEISRDNTVNHFSYLSEKYLINFCFYVNKILTNMFKSMDTIDLLKRYQRVQGTKAIILGSIVKAFPSLMSSYFNKKDTRIVSSLEFSHLNVDYLDFNYKKKFDYKNVSFWGWEIDSDIIAFETPGHTEDSISYYYKSAKALFVGDATVFLNPNEMLTGNIKDIHNTLHKIIKFAEIENVQFLGISHYDSKFGNNNVVNYLNKCLEKQLGVYGVLKSIILQKKSWKWSKLIERIYQNDSSYIKETLKINYPKSASTHVDVYVFSLLRELGYSKCMTGKWVCH